MLTVDVLTCPTVLPPILLCIAHAHCSKSGCRKKKAHKSWSMVIPGKAISVTVTTLRTTSPVTLDSRQLLIHTFSVLFLQMKRLR